MSIRSEIRAALVDGPKSTDELLPLVPSVEGDRRKLGWSMNDLASNQMVRRAGLSDDGKPLYQLDPKVWPEKRDTAETAGATQAARAVEAVKAAAPPAKVTRKTGRRVAAPVAVPAVIALEVYEVGLMVTGEALVHHRTTGAVSTIPRAVVEQIVAMSPRAA